MNRRATRILAIVSALSATAAQAVDPVVLSDPEGDTELHRTDPGADAPIPPTANHPDLLSVSFGRWIATDPIADPYTGSVPPAGVNGHLLRIDVVFAGLVNPPGPLAPGAPRDAFKYGPSPVVGFLEFDLDRNLNTGGVLGGAARDRFLGQVARFGGVPSGTFAPLATRVAATADDYDFIFDTGPQYERSGVDFTLALCGCADPVLVSQVGDGDSTFEPGETWIVRERFFRRAMGYNDGSVVDGGSDFGAYDPPVDLRFQHAVETDQTTLTLIYPLDQIGAAQLTGEPQQAVDFLIGDGSHHSVYEAVLDLVYAAQGLWGPLPASSQTLVAGWVSVFPTSVLDPTRWRVSSAMFGTSYAVIDDGAVFAWTDVGFAVVKGDVNGDAMADSTDRSLVNQSIAALDGTFDDADGLVDGTVHILDFGTNFNLYDVDGNGVINGDDLDFYGPTRICLADWDRDGIVNAFDLIGFLGAWFSTGPVADLNSDLVVNVFDILAFLESYYLGC